MGVCVACVGDKKGEETEGGEKSFRSKFFRPQLGEEEFRLVFVPCPARPFSLRYGLSCARGGGMKVGAGEGRENPGRKIGWKRRAFFPSPTPTGDLYLARP